MSEIVDLDENLMTREDLREAEEIGAISPLMARRVRQLIMCHAFYRDLVVAVQKWANESGMGQPFISELFGILANGRVR